MPIIINVNTMIVHHNILIVINVYTHVCIKSVCYNNYANSKRCVV